MAEVTESVRLGKALRAMLRNELTPTPSSSVLLVRRAVGCLFQVPVSVLLSARGTGTIELHHGVVNSQATRRSIPRKHPGPYSSSSRRRPASAIYELSPRDELSWNGCSPPPLSAFFEVLNPSGAPYEVLDGLQRIENCSWLHPILRRAVLLGWTYCMH